MSGRRYHVEVLAADNATIVDLEGDIDFESGAAEFKETMRGLIDAGERHILVDLTRVSLMDSTGLGVLVRSEQRLRPLRGSLGVICGDRLRRILTITGLCDVMAVHATRIEALQAASGAHGPAGEVPPAQSL